MTDILMRLGEFKFSVDTAAYDSLSRTLEIRWPSQERLWSAPAVQFTGIGEESIRLSGKVLPAFRGGLKQIDTLRELARSPERNIGEPFPLVTGWGEYLGDFVITNVEEQQDTFLMMGAPGVQSFTLTLKRYIGEVYS